jgi:hypothetical protein
MDSWGIIGKRRFSGLQTVTAGSGDSIPSVDTEEADVMTLHGTIRARPVGKGIANCVAIALLATGTARGGETADPGVSAASVQQRTGLSLHANAGEDQVAKVGDRVTLDGGGSLPGTGVSYRWITAGGPPIRLKIDDQRIYTWIPETSGVYRFALVVAVDGRISEADYVDVTVSDVPVAASTNAAAASATREGLNALGVSEALSTELAEIYARIAGRMDLYESYNELLHELSRALEPLIPADPATRSAWNERLFVPLSGRLVDRLRAESLDLTRSDALAAPFNAAQRGALARFFAEVAEGCRTFRNDRR